MSEWRYIAQALPSGEWLHWDVPLSGVDISHELSGPGGLTGTIPVELAGLTREDGSLLLEPQACAIWAEASGVIRGGGILVRREANGQQLRLECAGYPSYPHGQHWPWAEYRGVQVDPLDVARLIWSNLQGEPDGDLGVVVDGTRSPVRIGTEPEDVKFTTGAGDDVEFEAGPLKMNHWSTFDLGRQFDDLIVQAGAEYLPHVAWDGDSGRLKHRLQIGVPRIGQRRHDMRFVVGENVTVDPAQVASGDNYATQVTVFGPGEGRKRVSGSASAKRRGLRRAVAFVDESIPAAAVAEKLARIEIRARSAAASISDVSVMQSPMAEVMAVRPGDEIFVQSDVGWLEFAEWVRVLAVTYSPDNLDVVRLRVARPEESLW